MLTINIAKSNTFPHETPLLTPCNEKAGYLYAILDSAPEQAGTRLHFVRNLNRAWTAFSNHLKKD